MNPVFILALVALTSAVAEDARVEKDYLENIIKARSYMQKYQVDNEIPGIVIGVSVEGKTVWTEAFGYSDLENNVRASPETFMRIASISKTFTGIYAAKLVEEGRLDLDVPIQDYLGEEAFPRKQWQGEPVNITTRLLLQHSAGIRPSAFPEDDEKIYYPKNQAERIAVMKNGDLIFKPGTNWTYSNWGIEVAAAVVESIIEKDYVAEIERFYREHFGLRHTRVDDNRLHSHRSQYYQNDYGELTRGDLYDETVPLTNPFSGGLVSTVGDLLKYGNALLDIFNGNNAFLNSATLKEFLKPNPLATEEMKKEEPNTSYGMVFELQSFTDSKHASGKHNFGHTGRLGGVHSQLTIHPESGVVVAFISNYGSCDVLPNLDIADIFAKK